MTARRFAVALVALLACLAASCMASPASVSSSQSGPVVKAPAGEVQGYAEGELRVFKGIPYAAPPVGPARWKPPAPAPRWSGAKDATKFGAACVQPTPRGQSIYSSDLGQTSEDCLTLNIWTPAKEGDHRHAAQENAEGHFIVPVHRLCRLPGATARLSKCCMLPLRKAPRALDPDRQDCAHSKDRSGN